MSVPRVLRLQSTRALLAVSALLGDCFRICDCRHVYIRRKPISRKKRRNDHLQSNSK